MVRVFNHTSVLDVEVTLRCHGRRARLSLRAMAPFPIMMNLDLINPRWRLYIELLKIRSDKKFDELTEKMKLQTSV